MEESNIPTTAPAEPSKPDTTMSDAPQKYVPQFSAATEMILKRINAGVAASSLTPLNHSAKYEDMRRSVLMGMKTSMNMELPSTPPTGRAARQQKNGGSGRKASSTTPVPSSVGSAGGKGKGRGKGKGKAGGKRKRAQEEEEEMSEEESEDDMSQLGGDSEDDDGGEISELPKITQSGRQINKPSSYVPASYEAPPKKRAATAKKVQEQALCKRCSRGHSPNNNMIVFCDGCNHGWHQLCHDPPISEETVKDEAAPWFCAECSRKKGGKTGSQEQAPRVSWQGRSPDDKRNYFQSLPHQQLVSLLMQTTILHPNIPIFPPLPAQPSNSQSKPSVSRSNSHSQLPFPPSAASAAGLFQRSESNPRASMNFIRKIPQGSNSPLPAPQPPSHTPNLNQNPPPAGDSRESTPASPPYPKPGNGLMAKLGPDEEDLEWLVDGSDFDAFSHTVYDDQGNAHSVGVNEENGIVVGASTGNVPSTGLSSIELGINGAGAATGHGHGL